MWTRRWVSWRSSSENISNKHEPCIRVSFLPEYAARLRQKGVTVRKLFEEYSHGHPDGYRHANFGILLLRYMLQTKAVGHVEHYAGDQMYHNKQWT